MGAVVVAHAVQGPGGTTRIMLRDRDRSPAAQEDLAGVFDIRRQYVRNARQVSCDVAGQPVILTGREQALESHSQGLTDSLRQLAEKIWLLDETVHPFIKNALGPIVY